MSVKKSPYRVQLIFYKYDISEEQDGSDVEYEILFKDFVNEGFWIPDLSWLEEMVIHEDLDSLDCFADLPCGQVHEVVAGVEPWAEQDPYAGDWDGGLHWHEFSHQRLTGKALKEFLTCYPRCNRLQGMEEENIFKEEGGEGICASMSYELAIGSLDVPEELRHLPDDTMEAMQRYFKQTFKKYALMENE